MTVDATFYKVNFNVNQFHSLEYLIICVSIVIIYQRKKMFLCDLSFELLAKKLQEQEVPSFLVDQIVQWIYEKNVKSWNEMSNLSLERREGLAKVLKFPALKFIEVFPQDNLNGWKFLWKLTDGLYIETFLVKEKGNFIVFLSSQVGYPSSVFLHASKQGSKRNLKVAEIVEQFIHINHWLKDEKITHIVFKGIGEPLRNYDNVTSAIRIFSHPKMLNFSSQKITLHTVGIDDAIMELTREEFRLNLAIELHAPNQKLRQRIVPCASQYPLDKLFPVIDNYLSATKKEVIFEYSLIKDVNDQPQHAQELAGLLRKYKCKVNLTYFKETQGLKYLPSSKVVMKEFRTILFALGIPNKLLSN